jgi:hypothetical protein
LIVLNLHWLTEATAIKTNDGRYYRTMDKIRLDNGTQIFWMES